MRNRSGESNVALLDRKVKQRDLDANYTSEKENSTWLGTAVVPIDYLPPGVNAISVFTTCANSSHVNTQRPVSYTLCE